jgi:hypothetical protein
MMSTRHLSRTKSSHPLLRTTNLAAQMMMLLMLMMLMMLVLVILLLQLLVAVLCWPLWWLVEGG